MIMKNLILPLLVLLAAASFFACKKQPKPGYSTVKLDEVFELKLNQSVVVEGNDLKLTFTGVPEDSRCPKGVNCFQEGQVKVTLSAASGSMNQTVEFTKVPSNKNNVTKSVDVFKIQLLDVAPYPENGKKTKPEDYSAKLAVRKSGK